MAVRSKIEPIDRDIDVLINEELSPAARSRYLSDFAKAQLAEGQQRNRMALGFVPPHKTTVDERRNAPVESVKPEGVIVFEFELIDAALAEIGRMLVLASPVKTGRFQGSHVLFADGVEVDPANPPQSAQEYAFVNTQPYARKIERGLSPQAPEGVYQTIAVLASRRFGNIARIRYGFRSLPSGAIGRWAMTGTARAMAKNIRGGNPRGHTDWLTRQPSVIVTTGR